VKEEEPKMKIKNNKNTSEAPQKSSNSDETEGNRIFIHGVSEEAQYDQFQPSVEKFGEVTDFYNTGKGFAFLTFSTNKEAAACIAGMNNTEVAGRSLRMQIAKPKGEKNQNQSFGGSANESMSEGGKKIFIGNVAEEAQWEDFQEKVEKFGEVIDFFNSGKGFAFLTFATPEQAKACIDAMNNTEVAGQTIRMNHAKPKGAPAPAGGGGGGGARGGDDGAKLFIANVDENTSSGDLQEAFSQHGTVTDAYNTGKGFAFVTFSSASEAEAAVAGMAGTEVCGRTIDCNIARPKGDKSPRGGRGGGRGGRGRGGRDRGGGRGRGGRGGGRGRGRGGR